MRTRVEERIETEYNRGGCSLQGREKAKGVTEVRVIAEWIESILTKRRGKALAQVQGGVA